jgi:hypothetical protein
MVEMGVGEGPVLDRQLASNAAVAAAAAAAQVGEEQVPVVAPRLPSDVGVQFMASMKGTTLAGAMVNVFAGEEDEVEVDSGVEDPPATAGIGAGPLPDS